MDMSRFAVLLIAMTTFTLNTFAAAAQQPGSTPHDGWSFTSARADIAPQASVREDGAAYGLVITGTGDAIADGRWIKRVPIPTGEYVSFAARYRATHIEM